MSDQQIKAGAERRGRAAVAKRAQALERMVVEYVPIESVMPNKYNPNRQDPREFELLKASMLEDGFTAPIVAHVETREIVDGEHRWRAARDVGFTEIPVVFTSMTPEQMRIATLRHNRAVGSEDVDLAAVLLRDLRTLGALDWAQESLGLDDDVLQKLIDDVSAPEDLAGEQFSEAWVPTKNTQVGGLVVHTERESVSFTPAASELQTQFGIRIKAAETDEQRRALEVEQHQSTYRLTLTLTNEDAALAKRVLGQAPALKILEMCRAKDAKDAEVKS